MASDVAPLPQCVGAEAVDEEEVWFGFFEGFGDPTMHDGAILEVGDGGSKP